MDDFKDNIHNFELDRNDFEEYDAERVAFSEYCNDSYLEPSKNVDSIVNQREALTTQILNFQYECTICYGVLKPYNPIWSCDNCYHIFHIDCIKKWYKTCVDNIENIKWRCPTCQKEYAVPEKEIIYHCYCGKLKNPSFKFGSLMHSCDDVCGKSNKNNTRCPHLCSIQCHPGPCPSCDASLTSKCYCLKTTLTVKCSISETHLICHNKCEKPLNCSIHVCQKSCHFGACDPCEEVIVQLCYCTKESRNVLCGSFLTLEPMFSCENICGSMKDCNNHKCEEMCHSGLCESCIYLPKNVNYCPCGKTELLKLAESSSIDGNRQNCLDPIPVCAEKCNKRFDNCLHNCTIQCHQGNCSPCLLSSSVKCRCKKTTQTIKCAEIVRLSSIGKSVQCSNRCKSKKLCGIHRCIETCCDNDVHICEQICKKRLSCQIHTCEKICHPGNCPTCSNVSFDELSCECGAEVILPPIACGQAPPICEQVCTRQHSCQHEVLHNCHSEPQCSVCTFLMSKECPGGHKIMDNIPCFRPVVTCGSKCGKQLPDCDHKCVKDCHIGPCINESFKCTQPCNKTRHDCPHLCFNPCHIGDCQDVMKPCMVQVILKCSCNKKSLSITCIKIQQTIVQIKSNTIQIKKNGLDVRLAEKNYDELILNCDNECKKIARTKQNMEAYEMEILLSDNVSYSGFLRDFSTKNPNFLVKVDGEFVKLIRKLESDKLTKCLFRFEPMNHDKRRFIHELCTYFGLKSLSSDPDPKRFVTIEAVKGFCKIPNPRLLQFMQRNYPQLFKAERQSSLKYIIPQTPMNRLSLTNNFK